MQVLHAEFSFWSLLFVARWFFWTYALDVWRCFGRWLIVFIYESTFLVPHHGLWVNWMLNQLTVLWPVSVQREKTSAGFFIPDSVQPFPTQVHLPNPLIHILTKQYTKKTSRLVLHYISLPKPLYFRLLAFFCFLLSLSDLKILQLRKSEYLLST